MVCSNLEEMCFQLLVYNFFQNFSQHTRERNSTVAVRSRVLSVFPGFRIGLIFPVLNSAGRTPVANYSLKIIDSWVDICCFTVFSSNGEIISGPGDFRGFNCERRPSISVGVTGTNVWSELILLGPIGQSNVLSRLL